MATSDTIVAAENSDDLGMKLTNTGAAVLRYGLVLVLLWVGGLKFTAYEAKGIEPLVSNSPLLSWTYSILSVQGLSIALAASKSCWDC